MTCASALLIQGVSEAAQVGRKSPHHIDKRPLFVLFASGANRETHVWAELVLAGEGGWC